MALAIDHPTRRLSSTTPHLLPFHIHYSGPANVSTYFRIREAGTPVGTSQSRSVDDVDNHEELSQTAAAGLAEKEDEMVLDGNDAENSVTTRVELNVGATDSQTTVVASESQTDFNASAAASAVTLVDNDSQPPASSASVTPPSIASPVQPSNSADSIKLLAAFRGRQLVGKRVPLPEGYGGLVLRTPEKNTANSNSTAPPPSSGRITGRDARESRGGRQTRRGKSRHFPVEVEDEDMDGDVANGSAGEGAEDAEQDVRRLEPTARFDSFMMWNPDLPPDDGRDEYLRTLTEWVSLAREVHQCEE